MVFSKNKNFNNDLQKKADNKNGRRKAVLKTEGKIFSM